MRIERDFASYVGKKTKERRDARNLFLIGIARPFLLRGVKVGVDWLTGTDEASVSERIALVRARAERQIDEIQRDAPNDRRRDRGAPDRGLIPARHPALHSPRASGGMADAPALGAGAA